MRVAFLCLAVAAVLVAGCVYDAEDGDIRVTVTNDTGRDLWLEVDDPVWGWRYVTEIENGETIFLYFDDDVDGEELRAQDDDDNTVDEITIQHGSSWDILGLSS